MIHDLPDNKEPKKNHSVNIIYPEPIKILENILRYNYSGDIMKNTIDLSARIFIITCITLQITNYNCTAYSVWLKQAQVWGQQQKRSGRGINNKVGLKFLCVLHPWFPFC